MSLISQITIDKVSDDVSLVELAGHYGVSCKKGTGGKYLAKCPFHDDKKEGSFFIFPNNTYKCFSCGEGGSKGGSMNIDFVMKIAGKSYAEAITEICSIKGYPIVYDPSNKTYTEEQKTAYAKKKAIQQSAQDLLNTAQHYFSQSMSEVLDFCEQRGFDKNTIAAFQLGFAPKSAADFFAAFGQNLDTKLLHQLSLSTLYNGTPYPFLTNRITIPIHNRKGELVGFAGRALAKDEKPKYVNPRNVSEENPDALYEKSTLLYGYAQAKELLKKHKSDLLYLVEGYPNVWRLHQNGIAAVATGGLALSEKQVALMSELTDRFVICRDRDKAGKLATARDMAILLATGEDVFVCLVPENQDIDDVGKEIADLQPLGLNPYNDLQDYIDNHTYPWLDYAIAETSDDATPESRVKQQMEMYAYIQAIPDNFLQEEYAYEIEKHYIKGFSKTYKSRKKEERNTFENEDEDNRERVRVADNGTGIFVMNFCISNFSAKLVYIIDKRNSRKNAVPKYDWLFEVWQLGCDKRTILSIPSDNFCTAQNLHKYLHPMGFSYRADETQHKLFIEHINKNMVRTKDVMRCGFDKDSGLFFYSNCALKPNIPIGQENPTFTDRTATILYEEKGYRLPLEKEAKEGNETADYLDYFYQENKEISLLQIATLVQEAWEDKAIMTIAFSIATMFFDIITKKTRSFPLYYLWTALPSTGKSTLCQLNTCFFGRNRKFSIASERTSIAALSRVVQNNPNIPVLLDEFSRNKAMQDKINLLQQFYDLKGHTIVDANDFESAYTFQVNTGIFVTSNLIPLEPIYEAFRSRLFHVELKKSNTDEAFAAYKEINTMMEDNLSHISANILIHRERIEREFKSVFDEMYQLLKKPLIEKNAKTLERLFGNGATILTPTIILLRAGLIELPANENDLIQYTIEILEKQVEEENNISPLYEFWLAASEAIQEKKLGSPAHFKKIKTETDSFYKFRFDKFYNIYKNAQKGLGYDNGMLSNSEARSLLKRQSYFLDSLDSERFQMDEEDLAKYKLKQGVPSPKSTMPTSCMLMDYTLFRKQFDFDI